MSNYDAVLLTSFGGPEDPDEVMPYLERVTAGRGVPYERLVEVSHHYMAMGGVSPINAQNRALLAAMREHFPTRGLNMPIYWGNRNSEPFFADVLKQMYADGHRKILAFVTSAYSSYSGCRQYRENLGVALEEAGLVGKLQIDKVRHYFDHPGFVAPVAEDLSAKLVGLYGKGLAPSEIAIMFATHSIPSSMGETSGPSDRREEFKALAVEAPAQYGEAPLLAAGKELPWNDTRASGGAYAAQHLAAARVIMGLVEVEAPDVASPKELPHWSLVYQSRSGAPTMPWLEPDINDAIAAAAETGARAIVVVPIGFVSDHVEVVWDLDNEAKETSEELGLAFERVATAGVAPEFVKGIADLVIERESVGAAGSEKRKALSPLGPWRDFCSADCCPNARRQLPVVAEL
jgi:ferrochelatase